MSDTTIETLQQEWNQLYRKTLPDAARRHDFVQTKWSVTLDHCFARIILDNAIGVDRPWDQVVKSPAVKNMNEEQFKRAIGLGRQIAAGDEALVELDHRSLALRGKTKGSPELKRDHNSVDTGDDQLEGLQWRKKSRKGEIADIWGGFSARQPRGAVTKTPTTTQPLSASMKFAESSGSDDQASKIAATAISEHSKTCALINGDESITPFRRRVLILLTQVPRGRYSTYKALAAGVASTTRGSTISSSARAVGSAMRNNPFAPRVPCHRILAADGKIGGFGGDWGDDGRFAKEKRRLLREEGIKFDGHGRAVGSPFTAFT